MNEPKTSEMLWNNSEKLLSDKWEDEIGKLMECGKLQLSEIEMIMSMFPDASEFSIEGKGLEELKGFINGSEVPPSIIEYSIHLSTNKGKVSLHVVIPTCYPFEPPDIYVRSNKMSRQKQHELNEKLNEHLNQMDIGELMIGSAVLWLQENAEHFLTDELMSIGEKESNNQDLIFSRAWIYSHHIYSKVKRKDIRDLAVEYQLTGFCLPGKPGIMCVEGTSSNVKEWWQTIRSWNWQKILCKRIEEDEVTCSSDFAKLYRFADFQELGSNSNIRVKSSGYHVDMGDLFRYLDEHSSGYMFEEYFGVSGK